MKKIYLILSLALICFSNFSNAQIAADGLNNTSTLFTLSGGTYYTGNTPAGASPASSPYAAEGTHAYGVANGTATLTTTNNINTTGYTNISVSFRLVSLSVGSSANGAEDDDYVRIEISPNGGANYYSTLEVLGNSNARWPYTATGAASTPYDGNATPVQVQSGSGLQTGSGGISRMTVTGLPAVTNLRFRVTMLNDNANERWVVDDFRVTGTVNVTNEITTTAITPGTYPVVSGGNSISVGTGTLNAKGVIWGLSAASIGTLPVPAVAETEGRFHVAASGTASFSAALAGIKPGTTIFYRAYFTTASPANTVLGDIKTYIVPGKGTSLAFWNFGPDGGGYTESPASTILSTATLMPATGTGYDDNGKDGFIYSGAVRGQALTYDAAGSASNVVIRLNTEGYRDLHLRADYLAQTGGTYTLAYSTNGTAYTNISTTGAIPTNMTLAGAEDYNWGTIYHDLSGIAAVNDAANIYLRLTLNNGVANQFQLDNIDFFGTVCALPAQPGAISGIATSICSGVTQTYSVGAVSGATGYTWTLPFGWTGTSTTNSINATVGTTGGTISVVANNVCGSSTARVSAAITVNPTPTNPTGAISPAANPACGSTVLTYDNATANIYWQTAATGTSTTNVSTTPLNISTAGTYYVRAWNGSCWSSSSLASAAIVINAAANITVHPSLTGQMICSGAPLTSLSVTATATGIGYQWYSNTTASNVGGALIAGATTSTHVPSNTLLGTSYYYCVVSGAAPCASLASNVSGAITVENAPAAPTGTITGTTPSCGPTTINYSNYTGLEYWQTTATGTSTLTPVAVNGNLLVNASGNYYVRVRSAGGCWSAATPVFNVIVRIQPSIPTQPEDMTVTSPAAAQFITYASNANAGIQWQYHNGTAWVNLAEAAPYSGTQTTILNIASTTIAMDGANFRCILRGVAPCVDVISNDATLYVNPGPCMTESFTNIPGTISSYANRAWTGDMGGAWSATNARTDQTINGKAICTDGSGSVTSPTIANGMGVLRFNYVRAFTGTGTRTIKVFVNGSQIGADIAVSTNSNVAQQYTGNINTSGNVQLVLQTSGNQIIIDDVSWTCYNACTPNHTITSISPSSGPAGTWVTITGNSFSSITGLKIGEINISNYTVVSPTSILAQIPVGASTGKIFVLKSTCPVGSAGNFTVLTNNGNCNSAGGSIPSDVMISEVFDSPSGSIGYVELFNGTAADINLSTYKLQINSNTALNLSGTIDAGTTAVFEFGTSGTACGSGSYTNLTGSGFNEDDDIKLLKGAGNTIVDRVITPSYTGYSYSRSSTVGAPSATFTLAQWTNTNTSCTNIGGTDFVITPIISINTQPADRECLQSLSFSVGATANPNPVSSYRWMYNAPGTAGWLPLSGLSLAGITFGGTTNTANLVISGLTGQLRNYQFYCELTKDLAVDCITNSNAAQYRYESKLYYKAETSTGNWTTPGSWLMSDNIAAGFAATCTYPTAANCDAVIIPAGKKIIHDADISIDIDKITVETGGELELGVSAGLRILNSGAGADMIINGTLTDHASSGAGNGIDYEDNTGAANDASWILGANGTIIKTNNSSAANYRDFYAGGIASIPATATWIYRYIGTGTPAVVSADMYYPNLSFESTSGNFRWNTATTALTGAANTMTVKGNLLIGVSGSGTVSVHYNNINALPMQIGGNLLIDAGDTLTNISYDNTVTTSRGHGTGFDVKGNVSVNGVLTNNGGVANTGILRFSGATTQNVTGTGTMNLENVDIANSGTTGTGVDVQKSFAIPGVLSFATGTPKLTLSSGIITMKSSETRTAQVAAVPVNAIHYAAGKFEIERYLSSIKAWRFVSAPVTTASSPTIRAAWQEAGSTSITDYGAQITGPQGVAAGFDQLTNAASMKWYDTTVNNYKPIINTSDLLAKPTGYMLFVRGDRTVDISGPVKPTNLRVQGQINTQNQIFTISPLKVQSVGNPYPSAISFPALLAHTANSNVQSAYTAWDPKLNAPGGNSVGGYQYVSAISIPPFTPEPGLTTHYQSGISYPNIESGQAVYLTNSSQTAIVNGLITEGMKASGSKLVNREPTPGDRQFLRTRLYNNNDMLLDGNLVAFDDEFDNSIDRDDAVKFTNAGENFGIMRNGKKLAIEAHARLVATDTIQFNMQNMKEQTYSLKIIPLSLQSVNLQAIFVDKFLHTETPLNLSADTNRLNIVISAAAASKAADRFMIVFKSMAGPLPVTFVSVTAQRQADRSIAVNWKVANEINIVKYEVERSANGLLFSGILNTAASGLTNYTQADLSPLGADNFYRIKAVGLAGDISYSTIVKVAAEKSFPQIAVSPNPVKDKQLSVRFTQQPAGRYSLQLSNALGQLIYQGNILLADAAAVETVALPKSTTAGNYNLSIRNNDGELKYSESIIIE